MSVASAGTSALTETGVDTAFGFCDAANFLLLHWDSDRVLAREQVQASLETSNGKGCQCLGSIFAEIIR